MQKNLMSIDTFKQNRSKIKDTLNIGKEEDSSYKEDSDRSHMCYGENDSSCSEIHELEMNENENED